MKTPGSLMVDSVDYSGRPSSDTCLDPKELPIKQITLAEQPMFKLDLLRVQVCFPEPWSQCCYPKIIGSLQPISPKERDQTSNERNTYREP